MCVCVCARACYVASIVSGCLQPYGLQPSRLLCPWGFSRQEYWRGLPCPRPQDLLNPGMEPRSPALQAESLPSEPPGCTWINFVGIQFPAELQRHCLLSSSIRLLDSLFFHCRLPSGNCVFNSSHENVSRGGGFFFFFYHSFSWVFLTGRYLEPWEIFFYHVLCYFLLSISFLLLFSKTVSQMLRPDPLFSFTHIVCLLALWDISLFFIPWNFI